MKTTEFNAFKFCFLLSTLVISQVGKTQEQKIDSLPQIQVQDVEISALRLPFKQSNVPYGISVLPARINTQGLSLAENIAGLPGIVVNARYNFAVGDRITNRGFGARTQFGVRGVRIVMDDMPVTFADGQSNLEMIDIQDISYFELLKGPGSSLYGNASGGVLLIHSNPLSQDQIHSYASTTMGSNGLLRLNASVGCTSGRTRVEGSFTNFNYKGFRNHSLAEYNRGIVKLVSTISTTDIVKVNAGFVHFDALNPGSLTKQEVNQNVSLANPSSISNAAGKNGIQSQIAGTWNHQSDNGTFFEMTVYGIHRSVVNPIIGKIVELPQNSGGITAVYNSKLNIKGEIINWSVGTDMAFRFNNRKNYTNNKGVKGDLNLSQEEQILGTGIFLQVFAPITSKINIGGSIRFDQTDFGVIDKLVNDSNINNSGRRVMNGVSPSVGLVYHITRSLNCFANISTSFETPTSTELANRPDGAGGFNSGLNPSHALEYETGFRGYINPIFTYDITGYIIQTKDELIPFQVPLAPGQDYYRNAGSTVHRGGELAIRYLPFTYLDVVTSLTYIDAYYKNFTVKGVDYSGNKEVGITPIRVTAELKFHTFAGFYCSTLMQSFGKVFANDENTASADPYTVFDFGIGYDGFSWGNLWASKFIFSGGISNLFNTRYISAVTVNAAANRYYEPAPGRSFYLNARIEFGKH